MAACETTPRGRSDERLLAGRIDSIASRAVRDGQPAVSVAVARGGTVLLAKGYGFADVTAGVRARASTVYRIGSVTKQFTAAAVMDLADRGQLSVDDEVSRFLPDYPTRGHRLTLRHLLTHTSGIKSFTDLPEFDPISRRPASRDEVLALFAGSFEFPPGQQWAYSNSNYYLLGLVIEAASGVPYERYLAERIFGPLDMRDTAYCPDEPTGRNQAKGYELGFEDRPMPPPPVNMQHPFAAGALCSSVEDLVTWNGAFHGRRFLSDESYRLMTTPVSLDGGATFPYGFGLALGAPDGSPMISHEGGIPGFASVLAYFPTEDLTVAALVNSSSDKGRGLISAVMDAKAPACAARVRPLPQPGGAGGLPPNGGFEAGDLSGWTVRNQPGGLGDWFVYAGRTSPLSCTFLDLPAEGANAATTEPCGQFRPGAGLAKAPPARSAPCIEAADGPGAHVLFRDLELAPGMAHRLEFSAHYQNQAGMFASPSTLDFRARPNQQYRVDVLHASADPFSLEPADVLATPFQTQPGDPPFLAATTISVDLTPFAGTTVRLRFAEVDNLSMFQAGVDAVRVTSGARP